MNMKKLKISLSMLVIALAIAGTVTANKLATKVPPCSVVEVGGYTCPGGSVECCDNGGTIKMKS
jgi:hypothetical protein